MDNRLIEAEKVIASKDAIINLLKRQLSKLEESYKNNLIQSEQFRYKFCVTFEQLRRIKISATLQNQKCLKPISSSLKVDAKTIHSLQQNIEENKKLLHFLLHNLDGKKNSNDFQSHSRPKLYPEKIISSEIIPNLSVEDLNNLEHKKNSCTIISNKKLESSNVQLQNENTFKSANTENMTNKNDFQQTTADFEASANISKQIGEVLNYLSNLITTQDYICEQLENIKDMTNTSQNNNEIGTNLITTVEQQNLVLEAIRQQSDDFLAKIDCRLNKKFYDIIISTIKDLEQLKMTCTCNKNEMLEQNQYKNCHCSIKANNKNNNVEEIEENKIEFSHTNRKIDKLSKNIEDLKLIIKANADPTCKKTVKSKSCQCFCESARKVDTKNEHNNFEKEPSFNLNTTIVTEKNYDFLECICPTKDNNKDLQPNEEFDATQMSVRATEHLHECIQSSRNKNQKLQISMSSMLQELEKNPNFFKLEPYENCKSDNKHCQTVMPSASSKSSIQNTSNSLVTSDEEVKIEDIYKAVSFAWGYKQPKPILEPILGAKTCIHQSSFESNNDTVASTPSQSECTNCLFLEKKCEGKSLMSNLQIYVDYLHEQLNIISNIEDQIVNIKCNIGETK